MSYIEYHINIIINKQRMLLRKTWRYSTLTRARQRVGKTLHQSFISCISHIPYYFLFIFVRYACAIFIGPSKYKRGSMALLRTSYPLSEQVNISCNKIDPVNINIIIVVENNDGISKIQRKSQFIFFFFSHVFILKMCSYFYYDGAVLLAYSFLISRMKR